MAEQHAPSAESHGMDMEAHRQTYEGFLHGAIGIAIESFYVLVALCSFAFAHTWPVFLGFAGIVLGALFVVIDWRTGSKRYLLSLGGLVVFGLITAINVS